MRKPAIEATGLPGNVVNLGWVAESLQALGLDTDGGVPAASSRQQRSRPAR